LPESDAASVAVSKLENGWKGLRLTSAGDGGIQELRSKKAL